jgi:hypothetical protein
MEKRDIFVALGLVLLAMFSSCVKWINEMEKGPQLLITLFSGSVSAALSGVFIYLAYESFGLNVHLAFALAGACGYGGASGLNHISKILIHHTLLKGIDYKPELLDEQKK